jgi:organic radical activating enzyme
MSLNHQVREGRRPTDESVLDVVDVWRTIQGEGPFAGRPAVFLRLAGCNLQCPLCDTNYTRNRRVLSCQGLAVSINGLAGMSWTGEGKLLVVTGGEPFRQDLNPLLDQLGSGIGAGWTVQVETNGTFWSYAVARTEVVCSPKTVRVHPKTEPHVSAWKYISSAGSIDKEDGLPTSSLGYPYRPARPDRRILQDTPEVVYLQPADEGDPDQNAANVRETVAVCLDKGYRISIQLHKLLGVR